MPRDFVALRRLCADAVSDGVVPGAVMLVSCDGKPVFFEACGRRQIEPASLPATPETIYDVASVTKAAVTSILTMQAVRDKLLRLDDAVLHHLPEFADDRVDGDKGAVTIRQLLAHAGGLAAHRPFYAGVGRGAGPERRLEIMRKAAREPLVGPPGAKSLYTDLGFILLGWILERVGGARLDALARRAIFQPLGLAASMFVDVDAGTGPRPQDVGPVAATERCPSRQRMLVGEVHDLNAFAMGGIAGHAGLFSTAADLAAIAQALVSAWRGDATASLVDRDVVREFWRPAGIPGSSWRLGWDGPADENSQAGTRLSRAAVGHLGFTGCSLWIDPARDLIIVLLSNRVHPAVRDDPRFRQFRPAAHDAVLAALD